MIPFPPLLQRCPMYPVSSCRFPYFQILLCLNPSSLFISIPSLDLVTPSALFIPLRNTPDLLSSSFTCFKYYFHDRRDGKIDRKTDRQVDWQIDRLILDRSLSASLYLSDFNVVTQVWIPLPIFHRWSQIKSIKFIKLDAAWSNVTTQLTEQLRAYIISDIPWWICSVIKNMLNGYGCNYILIHYTYLRITRNIIVVSGSFILLLTYSTGYTSYKYK